VTTPLQPQNTLLNAVVEAVRSGQPVRSLLDDERQRYLVTMRDLTHARRTAPTDDRMVLDYQIFHIEADLRWIDHTAARLGASRPEATR